MDFSAYPSIIYDFSGISTFIPRFVENTRSSFAKRGPKAQLGKEKSLRNNSFSGAGGSPSWTRTNDPAINSRMLYRLSY